MRPEIFIGSAILIGVLVVTTLGSITIRNKHKLNAALAQQTVTQGNNFVGPHPVNNRSTWQQEALDNLSQNDNEHLGSQVVVNEKPTNVVNNKGIVHQQPVIIKPNGQTIDYKQSSKPD